MKTIFITIFEGVEAKNILRTDIVPTILSRPDVRIVLLMKNPDRIKAYLEEFHDPRLIYEVVPYSRSLGRGLDRFFAQLKFLLLRTPSTDLQRRLAFETEKNYPAYLASVFANFILARSVFRRLARYLDYVLVKNDDYSKYYDKYNPDLVFLAHLFEEPEIHLLREAKKRGIKTIGFINSWDKTTMRCVMRLFPDKFVVFNNIVKDELIKYHGAEAKNIFVGGVPQYDYYFNGEASPRGNFFQKIGIDPGKKLIVYSPLGSAFSDSDWDAIDFLHELHDEGKFGKNTALLIRFHPKDFIDKMELQKRPYLVYDYTGVRFPSKTLVDWDMSFEDLRHLFDTLYYTDLLICYASSLSIDAAIFDQPIINIDFKIKKSNKILKSPALFYKMEHYKKAINTGGIKLVNSESELIKWVNLYLEDPVLERDGRKRLVDEQCKFTDGKSGERIGRFILKALYDNRQYF